MRKIWENQSFISISRVSLSSPKFKKCNFNKKLKVSIGQKHNKSIKVLTLNSKNLVNGKPGTW